jgi:hypothetical protein
MTTTPCSSCDFVHGETRKLSPYKWRCLKRPQQLSPPMGLEFVAPDWMPDPPYTLCTNRRALPGDCPDYAPRREPGDKQ